MVCPISPHAGIWFCFGLQRPYAHCLNHCECIGSAALLCPEDSVSLESFTTSGSETPVPSSSRIPEPQEEGFSTYVSPHNRFFFYFSFTEKSIFFIWYILIKVSPSPIPSRSYLHLLPSNPHSSCLPTESRHPKNEIKINRNDVRIDQNEQRQTLWDKVPPWMCKVCFVLAIYYWGWGPG